MILVTAAILTVQSSSMLQPSYAQSLSFQSCPDGSTPDASGNCPTLPPPAGGGETIEAPPPATTETPPPPATEAPPPATETPPPTAEAPPPATTETPPPPATEAPPPATTETPPPTAAPPAGASQGSNNTGSMSAEWANSILAVHNSERAAVGVPPLVWSNSLAAGAQAWAEHLAATGTGTLVHATDAQKGCPCGEVLAGFDWSKGPTAPGGGTSLWVAEKNDYNGGPVGNGYAPNGKPIGHYTQMVWRNEQEVGCGAAYGSPFSILVCRYNLPGNWPDESPYTATYTLPR
jgi:hypothetical protein